jgi:SulP family sulfate permease
MPLRFHPSTHSDAEPQQLPFTGDNVSDTDFSQGRPLVDASSNTLPRSRSTRASSITSGMLSSSYNPRNPVRSFAHRASHSTTDNPQYSSQGVRERTQELASYALEPEAYHEPWARASVADSETVSSVRTIPTEAGEWQSIDSFDTEEDSEPESPETVIGPGQREQNLLGSMSRGRDERKRPDAHFNMPHLRMPDVVVRDTEETPLLPKSRRSGDSQRQQKTSLASPSHPSSSYGLKARIIESLSVGQEHLAGVTRSVRNPKNYTKDAAVKGAVASAQMASAVFLGLLLNLLDALSYGYILFPLGSSVFSQTGPDGISIFFVSCIVSQLCYSLGLSSFKGGVGSEMIEVVPFFHKMAYSILARMEGKSPEAIMATTIVSYCLSSIVTGLIFLALGCFKLGNLVSFFPRHILIGCIGGVGFFLVVTGIEVSARLDGNLNYDLDTLYKLFSKDTVYLWVLPLVLAILVIVLRRRFKSPFVLPAFFLVIFATFYVIVKGILRLDLESVRNSGWIFEQPEAGVPFYRFYSYFSKSLLQVYPRLLTEPEFSQVDGAALASCIPTMFALSFFGIIHVPINVPALGAAVKEDNINVNRELIAHGISNTLSGCFGSIQVSYRCVTQCLLGPP